MTTNVASALKAWSLAMMCVGLVFVAAAVPALDWPARLFLDITFWPIDGRPDALSPELRLLSVIGGGVTAGWCLLLGLLFDRAHRQSDRELLRLAVISLLCWFVVDSLGSIAVGAWMNAVLNTIILAGFVLPLLINHRTSRSAPVGVQT
jgi:hypothetical protein